jgi:hypothetical protein
MSHLLGHQHEALEIVVSIDETVPGSTLDKRLRREQTEALLQLLAAHRSQVQIAPTPGAKEKPCG